MGKMKIAGEIITGCPRSGTTLALKVYCPDLEPGEERAGGKFNEPPPIYELVKNGDVQSVSSCLCGVINRNRHKIIKSPHVSFALPSVNPLYNVILTFRDLRLVIPSMVNHWIVSKVGLAKLPYWKKYTCADIPSRTIPKACAFAKLFYEHAVQYKGPLRLWNYGYWNEWTTNRKDIANLYGDRNETSRDVIDDVNNNITYSFRSYDISIWESFVENIEATQEDIDAVKMTNDQIVDILRQRDLTAKLL